MAIKHYYTSVEKRGRIHAKVYHYAANGETEVVNYLSPGGFPDEASAEDAAVLWADENNIEVELG